MSPAPTARDIVALAGYVTFAGVLLSPLRHYVGPMKQVNRAKNEADSFPLSTYPMFSANRQGRVTVPHVVGITATGERVIPHYSHFGGGGLNQVRRQISRAVREGRATDVAQRYADSLETQRQHGATASRFSRENRIVEVIVVRSRFLFADYFTGAKSPSAESVHARALVGGTAEADLGAPLPKLKEPA